MAKAKTKRAARRTAAPRKRAARPTRAGTSRKTARPAARRKTARPARKAAARRPPSRKPAARKAAARKRPAPKPAARKAGARKTAVRKTPARKPAARAVVPKPVVKRPPPKPHLRKAAAASPAPKPARQPRTAAPVVHGKPPALDRSRRRLPEADLVLSTPPSSLDLDRTASAARTGHAEIAEHLADHTETGPEITGGDVDASWESAYATGDEAPGGDNPTPDQDVVDDIGRSLGLTYEDNEELKGAEKITERDRHRWELDPASAEDYKER
jgi:hypothetical protein